MGRSGSRQRLRDLPGSWATLRLRALLSDPGGPGVSRRCCSTPVLPSARPMASAPTTFTFRGSIPRPANPLSTLRSRARARTRKTRFRPCGLSPSAVGTFTRASLSKVSGATSFLFGQASPGTPALGARGHRVRRSAPGARRSALGAEGSALGARGSGAQRSALAGSALGTRVLGAWCSAPGAQRSGRGAGPGRLGSGPQWGSSGNSASAGGGPRTALRQVRRLRLLDRQHGSLERAKRGCSLSPVDPSR
jgi:hypothetical protein